jgi:hypothetical protein
MSETLTKRHIIGAFDHDDTELIRRSLLGLAATLRSVAHYQTTPSEAVADARRAEALSQLFYEANASRGWVEENGLGKLACEVAKA